MGTKLKRYKYYKVVGYIDGEQYILFGSYNKGDCVYELASERESWKAEDYRYFQIISENTCVAPDKKVYAEEYKAGMFN